MCILIKRSERSVHADQLLLLDAHAIFALEAFLAGETPIIGPIDAVFEQASAKDILVLTFALDAVITLVSSAPFDLTGSSLELIVI